MSMDELFNKVIEIIRQPEIYYAILVFLLFIVPRILIRFGLPLAISSFLMGFGASMLGWRVGDSDIIRILAVLGIVSLFLFAGLEVNFQEIRKSGSILLQHLALRAGLALVVTFGIFYFLDLAIRPAALFALAILTPSTGFILDSLESLRVSEDGKYWIRTKAIAAEIFALLLMFALVRSATFENFAYAFLGLLVLLLVLPLVFRIFLKLVQPVAPRSEFGFLVILALISGLITKSLGAYYLIGAFVVGVVGGRFESVTPHLKGSTTMKSLKSFAGFFVPFYFFRAGFGLDGSEFTMGSVLTGLGLAVLVSPLRVFAIIWHRARSLHETRRESLAVALSLLPNLVFGLVLADLLKETFNVAPHLIGAIIVYTLAVSLLPTLLIKYVSNAPEHRRLAEMQSDLEESYWPFPGDEDNK